jgi:adenylosuccinate lyase
VLLALTQKGMPREEAYKLVQENAMRCWRGEGRLLDLLKTNPAVTRLLPAPELEEQFDLGYHYKEVDRIFARVFGRE